MTDWQQDGAVELTPSEAHFANQDEYEPFVTPLSIARWLHDHGESVFPLLERSKEPAVRWKTYRSTRQQAARLTHYGIWLRGRLIVIDADSPEVAAWMAAHLPPTPFWVSTGPYHDDSAGRGAHWYYRLDVPLPKFMHRDGLTIESRNGDCYVVGPGSRHPSGVIYTASNWSWQWSDIPPFPSDFCFDDGSCGARSASSAPAAPFEFPTAVTAGERHSMLFKQIRSWRHIFERKEAREGIHLMNLAHCRPPLVEDATFDRWFARVWNQPDRPLPATGLSALRGVHRIGSSLRGLKGA